MEEILERFSRLVGDEAINKLKNSKVIIFGIGGVGGYCAEAVARSGVGNITLVDSDTVSKSNINRQIIALESTVGKLKTSVMAERIRGIDPKICVFEMPIFFSEETSEKFKLSEYDYIIDAIDSVKSKILLIKTATALGVPIISSMGTGNKLDPEKLHIADISKTNTCPLAKKVRHELKKIGIEHLQTVFSTEVPKKPSSGAAPASSIFVPATAGMMMASKVIQDLIKTADDNE